MTADRPLRGIVLMLGFCLLAPLADALAKLLGARIPLIELLLARFAVQAVLPLPWLRRAGTGLRLPLRLLRLILLRSLLQILGIAAMFTSLRFLPLADAIAIAYVMPFFMLLLGWLVLGEEVGPRRLIACVFGFLGTLLVVQPSLANVGAPALLPLLVAVLFALFVLVTRGIAKEVDPMALQALGGMMALPFLLLALLLGWWSGAPALRLIPVGAGDALLLAATGVLGTLAHLLMTWALRYAPSATLAPMQYLEIPVATLFGLLIFGDFPDGLQAAGIVVTVAAGLYVIWRERLVLPGPA